MSTQSRDLCVAVCERLTHVVVASSDLVQSSVAAGPATEGVLKVGKPSAPLLVIQQSTNIT